MSGLLVNGLVVALLSAILVAAPSPARAGEPKYSKLFEGRDGCFELYDLKTNTLVVRFNPDRCAQRTSPCSTFKVPLALMAFDAGALLAETTSMKWDGKKRSRDAWNRDQTATTWMQNSVVWFSQRLTPILGIERVKAYLASFDYGNQDMTGGLTIAWLDSSLSISPDEQLTFWRRFWLEELSVSKHAFAMTKKITFVEKSASGWTLHGKTGSGGADASGPDGDASHWVIGWFVGHVSRGDREYLFVTSFTDPLASSDGRSPGVTARELTKQILKTMGLF